MWKCCTSMLKKYLLIFIAVLGSTLIANDELPTMAILKFDGRGIDPVATETLTDEFLIHAVNYGVFRVLERAQMDNILKEQKFQLSGCTTEECAVQIGEQLGVQYMLGTSIGKVGSTYTLTMRIISVETGEIVRVGNYQMSGKIDKLLTEGLAHAAEKIFGARPASITIQSEPSGSEVLLRGKKLGVTPITLSDLWADSSYSIKISHMGYDDLETVLTLSEGSNPAQKFTLMEQQGTLTMQSFTTGAPVVSRGDTLGFLPLHDIALPIGIYPISIKIPKHVKFSQKVSIKRGEHVDLEVVLLPKKRNKALVYSAVFPGTGQIYAEHGRRGALFVLTSTAALAGYFVSLSEFNKENDLLAQYHAEYQAATGYEDLALKKAVYTDQLEAVQSIQSRTNLLGVAVGVTWTLNLADVFFRSGLTK